MIAGGGGGFAGSSLGKVLRSAIVAGLVVGCGGGFSERVELTELAGSREGWVPATGILEAESLGSMQFDGDRAFEHIAVRREEAIVERVAEGARVRFADPHARLQFRLPAFCQGADTVTLVVGGLRGETPRLSWVEGSSLSSRFEAKGRAERVGARSDAFRFGVVPAVRADAVARVELEATIPNRFREIILERLECGREWFSPAKAARLGERRLRWEVDGDERPSLLTWRGKPRILTLPTGRGRRLEGAVSLPRWTHRAKVGIYSGRGEALFEAELDPGSPWTSYALALADDLTGTIELRVEAHLAVEAPVVAWWSEPSLWRRVQRKHRPPDVVLISVDTLRADHLSVYGYGVPTAPNLEAWVRAAGATVLPAAIAAAPWTLPAHASMFTGLDPHVHGVQFPDQKLAIENETLAEQFRKAGYRTLALTGGGYLDTRFGLGQGFDRYRAWRGRRGGNDQELEQHVALALDWLRDGDRPTFLFLHTYEVHGVLRRRDPYFERFGGDPAAAQMREEFEPAVPENGFVRTRRVVWAKPGRASPPGPADVAPHYDSGIGMMDELLGPLLRHLALPDVQRRTVVALTSDHGEMLGEHGMLNHLTLYSENLEVPFVVSARGRAPVSVNASFSRAIDVVPTLLDLAGLPVPDRLRGRSWFGSAKESPPALSLAASTNRGVALQDDRSRLVRRLTVWPEHALVPGARGAGDQAELSRRLERELARGVGSWILFQNPGAIAFGGELRGLAVRSNSLKALEAPPRAFDFKAEGAIDFEVQPKASFTAWVMRPEQISIRVGGGALQPRAGAYSSLVRDGASWRVRHRALEAAETGLQVLWRPGAVEQIESRPESEAALRALGYLAD